MTDQTHYYLLSGWCVCGHHRDDGLRPERHTPDLPTRAEIRAILGPTYQPKERR